MDLHCSKSFVNVHSKMFDARPGIDPYPLLAWLCNRWWPDFVTFIACTKSRFGLKGAKRHNVFQTDANINLSKNILGLVALYWNHWIWLPLMVRKLGFLYRLNGVLFHFRKHDLAYLCNMHNFLILLCYRNWNIPKKPFPQTNYHVERVIDSAWYCLNLWQPLQI